MTVLIFTFQLFFSHLPLQGVEKKTPPSDPTACASVLLSEDQYLDVIKSELDRLILKAPAAYRILLKTLRQGLEEQAMERCFLERNCSKEQVISFTREVFQRKSDHLRKEPVDRIKRAESYAKIAAPVALALLGTTFYLHRLPEHPSAMQQFIGELVRLTTALIVFTFGAPLTDRLRARVKFWAFRWLDPEPPPDGVRVHSIADYDRVAIDAGKTLDDYETLARDTLIAAVRGVGSDFSLALDTANRAKPGECLAPKDLKLLADQIATALIDLRIPYLAIPPEQPMLVDRVHASFTRHAPCELRRQVYPLVLETLKSRDSDARESREVFEYYERMLRGLLFLPDEEKL